MSHRAFLGNLKSASYLKVMRDGLEYARFGAQVGGDTKVFVKPNLTYPAYRPGVMTSPEAVEAAVVAIRDYTSHIYIGYNRFSMDDVYRRVGVLDLAKRYDVQVVNLSRVPSRSIMVRCQRRNLSVELPCLLTDEIDLLVTMPVPKVHNMTGVSLSFKNQWGCIPKPAQRLRLHPFFQDVILEVNKAVKTRFVMMDGRYGLNVNGPMRGHPVELGWVLVADDPGAAARVACELMRIHLETIQHLRRAKRSGLIPDMCDISLSTDMRPFQKERFFLEREWTDYPGFFAFNSSVLAYLAYFSPLSALLHKLLYLFREPYYDYEAPEDTRP